MAEVVMTVAGASLPQMELITKSAALASVRRARKSLEDAAAEVVWQVEREVWVVLGYKSWTEMREAEYQGTAFIVPSKNRPELVARMRAKGLTQQEIAATAGVSQQTVGRDLANIQTDIEPESITNSRGHQRPATYARTKTEDVVDAEVIEDDISEEEFSAQVGHLDDADFDDAIASARAEGDLSRRNVASHIDRETGEVLDPQNETTDPAPAESVETVACPTCHGTGKVTRS